MFETKLCNNSMEGMFDFYAVNRYNYEKCGREYRKAMKVDRKETLRYLGYRGQNPDIQTEELINEVSEELEQNSLPKSVYREYDCSIAGNLVQVGPLTVNSSHLSRNLQGCEKVVILAATIGRCADLMIKKYSVTNMAKAAVVQAAGASAIENYVDEVEAEVRKSAEERGLYLRPRFSPGYGDFPLEYQKEVFQLLECSKRIGVTLTAGNLMMPTKSVTAVIGLTTQKQKSCHQKNCSSCEKTDCEFRLEG